MSNGKIKKRVDLNNKNNNNNSNNKIIATV